VTTTPLDLDSLLRALRERGVILSARGTALDFDAPADALTDELVEAMRQFKPDILARLAGQPGEVVCTAPTSRCQARQVESTLRTDTPQTLTVAMRFALHGPLDEGALRQALTGLVTRHAALRTRYLLRDGEIRQEVLAPGPPQLSVVDAAPDQLDATIQAWVDKPFALEAEPSFRALLARVGGAAPDPHRHELALAMHHGIIDGWSTEVLVRDLGALYTAAVTGQPADLPTLTADYLDFCEWERGHLASERTHRMLREWAGAMGADTVPLLLPTDRPRSASTSAAGAHLTGSIPADLFGAVTSYAARRNVTPFVVLAAAFAALLHEISGAPSITLTVPVANRVDPRFADVVGVFAQAAWLIIPVRGATSFDDLVGRTATATWQMLALQSVPSMVQNDALGDAFAGRPRRVYLAMLEMNDPVLRLSGLEPAPARDVLVSAARNDQVWELRPLREGGLSLVVEYATALFEVDTVARWLSDYLFLLRRALADSGSSLPAVRRRPPTGRAG